MVSDGTTAEEGRTRWLRFGAVFGLGLLITGVLLVGVARGALAASFTVTGQSFKVSADSLRGSGFVMLGGVDRGADEAHPVAVSAFRSSELDNFCQSAVVSGLPIVGDLTLKMVSPGPAGMAATDIVIGVAELRGDLTMAGPQIGVDAAHVSKGPEGVKGAVGTFALQADEVRVGAVRQTAWSTVAHTIRLKELVLTVERGRSECF